jgi:hypothetical protein
MEETRISFLLNDVVREMNRQADGLLRQKYEITYSQFLFLLMVQDTEKCDVTRLAGSLGVTRGAVSKRLHWFIDRELVTTHKLANDEKRLMISLTENGASLTKSASDYLERKFLKVITSATESNQSNLRGELQAMLGALQSK